MRSSKQMGMEFFIVVFGILGLVAAGMWVATEQPVAGVAMAVGFGIAALAWMWSRDSTYRLQVTVAFAKNRLGAWYQRLVNLAIAIAMMIPFLILGGNHNKPWALLVLVVGFYAALTIEQWKRRYRREHGRPMPLDR